jgi:hypothetical protein
MVYHKTTNDTIVVSSDSLGQTEIFVQTFKTICQELNIPFAEPDPKFEKAYNLTTEGVVLILFCY